MSTVHHDILKEAVEVTTERSSTHGNAEDNFRHVASMWSAYLGVEVSDYDVCQMMALSKMSRSKKGNRQTKDHYVDQCGYSALAGRMAMGTAS